MIAIILINRWIRNEMRSDNKLRLSSSINIDHRHILIFSFWFFENTSLHFVRFLVFLFWQFSFWSQNWIKRTKMLQLLFSVGKFIIFFETSIWIFTRKLIFKGLQFADDAIATRECKQKENNFFWQVERTLESKSKYASTLCGGLSATDFNSVYQTYFCFASFRFIAVKPVGRHMPDHTWYVTLDVYIRNNHK